MLLQPAFVDGCADFSTLLFLLLLPIVSFVLCRVDLIFDVILVHVLDGVKVLEEFNILLAFLLKNHQLLDQISLAHVPTMAMVAFKEKQLLEKFRLTGILLEVFFWLN